MGLLILPSERFAVDREYIPRANLMIPTYRKATLASSCAFSTHAFIHPARCIYDLWGS
jgi:hypothetical protein